MSLLYSLRDKVIPLWVSLRCDPGLFQASLAAGPIGDLKSADGTLTAERRGNRAWVPQLGVPDYPVALEFQ